MACLNKTVVKLKNDMTNYLRYTFLKVTTSECNLLVENMCKSVSRGESTTRYMIFQPGERTK